MPAPSDQFRQFWLPSALIVGAALLAYAFALGADTRSASSVSAFPYINLVVHLLSGILVYLVADRYFLAAGWLTDRRRRQNGALGAALLFAVHPLASSAVNSAPGFEFQILALTALAACGSCLQLCLTLRWPWAITAAFSLMGCAFATPPGGLFSAIIAMAVLGAFFPFRQVVTRFAPRTRDKVIVGSIPLVIVAAAWDSLATLFAWMASVVGEAHYLGHVLTQGRVFWRYLIRMVCPIDLCNDHLIADSVSWQDGAAVSMTVGVATLVVMIGVSFFNRRLRAAAALTSLLVGSLLIWLVFVSQGSMVEARAYAALPWFAIGAGMVLALAAARNEPLGRASTLMIVVGCGLISAKQSAKWQDLSTLAREAIEDYPLNIHARNVLMENAIDEGNFHRVPPWHGETLAAWRMIQDFNRATATTGRRYPEGELLRELAVSHRHQLLALTQLKGTQAAVLYAKSAIPELRSERLAIEGAAATAPPASELIPEPSLADSGDPGTTADILRHP